MIGIGLLYWQGSYHQRLDPSGWQHDYWTEIDHASLPMALVTGDGGEPVTVTVPIRGRDVVVQAWRVDPIVLGFLNFTASCARRP